MKYVNQDTVDKLKLGNEDAFTEIYKHYRNVVFFMAITYFENDVTAEDIVQEVFMELNKHLDKIDTPQVLTVWINKIAYTKCLEVLRKKQVKATSYEGEEERIEDTSVDSDILDVINRKQINKLIKDSILGMDYDLKIVGLLRFYEELSIKEIADILIIPEGTVKSRIHTVKRTLRKELSNNGIIKPLLVVPFMSMNVKSSFHQMVKGAPSSNSNFISMKSVALVCMTSTLLVSTVVLIKNKEDPKVEAKISFDTKYTNKDIPILIETNQDYDSVFINGEQKMAITSNGDYTITLIKNKQEIYKKKIKVTNIDKDIPVLKNYKKDNNRIYLYVEDTQSGISPDAIRGIHNEVKLENILYDKNNQCISFDIQTGETYIVYIDDYAGNTLEVNLNLWEE